MPMINRGATAAWLDGRLLIVAVLVLLGSLGALRLVAPGPQDATKPPAPAQVAPPQAAPIFPTDPRIVPLVVPTLSQPSSIDGAPVAPDAPASQPFPASAPVAPAPATVPAVPQPNVMTVAPEDRAPGVGAPPRRNVMTIAPEDRAPAGPTPPQRNVMTIAPQDGGPVAVPPDASR